MYNSKTTSRFQELVEGSYNDSHGVEYRVDRDGCMIRIERSRPQVVAARESLNNASKKAN